MMYLMYTEDGHFMGILNEKLENNTLKHDMGYIFVSIPEELGFDEEKCMWVVPHDEIKIINR